MKTLVIYESKKGCTKKCAEYIHSKTQMSTISSLKDFNDSLENFETIIVLSPIYMGQVNKGIKEFITNNKSSVLNKPTTIGLCGMNKEGLEDVIQLNFDEDIRNHATIKLVGGAYYFDKLNFLQKLIVKSIAKVKSSVEEINYKKMDDIISKLQ
jgi:menaquinone-dependent protoporphyrinogen oxidase